MSNVVEFRKSEVNTQPAVGVDEEIVEDEELFFQQMLAQGFLIHHSEKGENRTLLNVHEIIPELDFVSLPFDINEVENEDFKNDILETLVDRWNNSEYEVVTSIETKTNEGLILPPNCWVVCDDYEGELIQSFELYKKYYLKHKNSWFTRLAANFGVVTMGNAYELDVLELLGAFDYEDDDE